VACNSLHCGFENETDPRHRSKVIGRIAGQRQGGICRGAAGGVWRPLKQTSSFCASAARLGDISYDSLDVQVAAKEVCRDMASSSQQTWQKVKVLATSSLERQPAIWKFAWQEDEPSTTLHSDNVWAVCGDPLTFVVCCCAGSIEYRVEIHSGTSCSQ
jgi:hypothetical protein